jgi:phosphoribosylformylglycinamidine synthase
MASRLPVLILTGNGLNCEEESRLAWERAGAEPILVHLHDLIERPALLRAYRALMLIGGFSYGDHLGSGLVLAARLRHHAREELARFVANGGLVMGVCNGFQVLIKFGLLPGLDGDYETPRLALMQNDCGSFQNRWVMIRFDPSSPCVFTRGLDRMELPVRHGEGKIYTRDRSLLDAMERSGCLACRYIDPASGEPTQAFPHNPNGSLNAVAGLCDPTGRIFGLMPHPEGYLHPENHPRWELDRHRGALACEGAGLQLFRNAVAYLA